MGDPTDFQGLSHDASQVVQAGEISFWPRGPLRVKLEWGIQGAEDGWTYQSGQASKFHGLANFFDSGMVGKLGRGGSLAVKDHQVEKDEVVTSEMLKTFDLVRMLVATKSQRRVPVGIPKVQ